MKKKCRSGANTIFQNSFNAPWHRFQKSLRDETVFPKVIRTFVFLMKKSPAGSTVMTAKAITYDSHNFHAMLNCLSL